MHEIEISEQIGAAAFGLRKGAGHKYIRRVPKPGGGYTYYYRQPQKRRESSGNLPELTHREMARATYRDPAFAVLGLIDRFKGEPVREWSALVDHKRGIAQDLQGRFGLDGPAPAPVRAALGGLAVAVAPLKSLDERLRGEGFASDERPQIMASAAAYAKHRGWDFTQQAQATYSDPEFAALRVRDELVGKSPREALDRINYHRGIAQDLQGRFGLNGPAPDAVRRVFDGAAAALQPVEDAASEMEARGHASDERASYLHDAKGYAHYLSLSEDR